MTILKVEGQTSICIYRYINITNAFFGYIFLENQMTDNIE